MPSDSPHPTSPVAELDTRGLLCPLPVLLTVREIAKLPTGGRLVVIGDDRGILEDLPAWCEVSGNRLVEIGEVADDTPDAPAAPALIRVVVEKTSG